MILKIWLGLIVLTGILISVHSLELKEDRAKEQTPPKALFKNENPLHGFREEIDRDKRMLIRHSVIRP